MEDQLSLVGGWRTPYSGHRFLARTSFSWPFGRLFLDREGIQLTARGPLKRLIGPNLPVAIPLGEITRVERFQWRWKFGGLRFRCADAHLDRTTFAGFQPAVGLLAERLRDLGLDVE